MSLLGKLTFSILGLKFFGWTGLIWGLCLGHVLIDRTIISKKLFQKLNSFDDTIRLLVPYRHYMLYDRIISHIFGKIWGLIIGYIIYGWKGSIIFFIVGHIIFDMLDNEHIKKTKIWIETTFNKHLIKLLGILLGYSLNSNILLLAGLAVGFVVDNIRNHGGLLSRIKPLSFFWPRVNWLRLALTSKDEKNLAFTRAMAALVAKVAKTDGLSIKEDQAFYKMFSIAKNYKELKEIFDKEKENDKDFEPFAKSIRILTKGDITLKEDVTDNLFKIAVSDGELSLTEIEKIKSIVKTINLPSGNFAAIRKRYEKTVINISAKKDYYKILGVSYGDSNNDIRIAWRKLTAKHHPDRAMGDGKDEEDIQKAQHKTAEINEAYQQIMKSRKK